MFLAVMSHLTMVRKPFCAVETLQGARVIDVNFHEGDYFGCFKDLNYVQGLTAHNCICFVVHVRSTL